MVHRGNSFARERRDRMEVHGETHDPAAIAFQEGKPLQAFSIEFGRDCLRAMLNVLKGLTVAVPYPVAAYSGWYHGVATVDSNHESQLANPLGAIYHLGYRALALISFSLASGAGTNLTLACFRPRRCYQGDKWHGVPREALRDLLRLYLLVIAAIFVASFWEYFAP